MNLFDTVLVYPLFNLLLVLYAFVRDFGVAVIILTLLVRILLWPVMNKQLHSQKAMRELAPEVAKVRKKAKGDRQLESQMLMELYKEKEINPFASFLPLLIQLPLFLALYAVLRDIVKPGMIHKLAYTSVSHLGPIKTIILNQHMFNPTLLGMVNMAKPSVVLAIIAAGAQFIQTKQLAPAKTEGDSQAQAMAIMTYAFPILTLVIGLTLPAALALYWAVTSLAAVYQQWIVLNKDVVELEKGKK
jgi:YidC/Oxa1 family membrane protein insertase